ncbi:creatininase family protein [Natronorarus salvus]|uniref:creatininase family protein n=1 Tax=Natronorarus salvus TaxID=3117733 RepID=UPI002F26B358
MRLATETSTGFADALTGAEVGVLPVGSTEQHGPALPLGTDFLTAEALAATAEDRSDTVVLPTVPVGVSDHHRQFHGTLTVPPETFEAYVEGTIESLASHGVENCVVVNGHGGNRDALSRVARRLRNDERAFVAPWSWFEAIEETVDEEFGAFPGHACQVESSMVLAVAQELVREDRLADAEAEAGESWGRQVHGAELGFDTLDFTESGAVGEPTKASAEAGERLFEAASGELDALIDWLAERGWSELRAHEHV